MTQLMFPKPKRLKGRNCRSSDRSDELKKQRGYTNPRSFVRLDGSERLVGKDWTKRKKELWVRCGGHCEQIVDEKHTKTGPGWYVRCRSAAHDPHHKIRRSVRRDDRLTNLEALCHMHHELEDERVPWPEKRKRGQQINRVELRF